MAARAVRAANATVKSVDPMMKKVWTSYTFQRGVQEQALSPFEVNIAGPDVIRGFFTKAKWMVQDRAHLVVPPIVLVAGTVAYVQHLRHEYLLSHRD